MHHVLPLVIETAEAARDRQTAVLAQAREAQRQADATLQRLRDFRADCLARRHGSGDAMALQAYQLFVGRLDEAIRMQEAQAGARAQAAEQQQQQLQKCQQRLTALQALLARDRQARQAREQRREQRAADEFAALAFARAAAGGGL